MATDFEEKYLLLRDENTSLKKKKNEQEATIKRYGISSCLHTGDVCMWPFMCINAACAFMQLCNGFVVVRLRAGCSRSWR